MYRQLALAALACFAAAPALAIDLVGTRSATFQWAPSTGPVYAYAVYVERNGGPRLTVELVQGTRATIEAAYGDEIVVSVRAVGFDGETTIYSDFSARSEPVRFLAPPRFGGSGTLALHCAPCGKVEFRSIADGSVLGTMSIPSRSWPTVAAGDIDGDGERDLFWRDDNTGALLLLLLQDYRLKQGYYRYLPDATEREPIGLGDFDGDGAAEIVLHNLVTGALELWKLVGGELALFLSLPGDATRDPVAIADLDADGDPDLVWQDPASGGLVTWTFEGAQVQSISNPGTARLPERVVETAADFNGDGQIDLLWRNPLNGALYISYLSQGRLVREAALPVLPGDEALRVAAAVDFTGVLGAEIVLQHRDTGDLFVAFPFSESIPSRLRIATPGSRWWAIDATN